ncbi:MAG: hypothetical protein A2050_14730 [Candidatus Rokubacteria bacterium GWA2_73_35]|nr:MAG: hypothetical protein A2050_14730 [Candidatus Rokubacteria bacterium GWA2_73_35]
MDAFYASVEQRDRPALAGRPVIVGADPRGRGVVSAASYEARVYGVRSAMPIGRAARLCPHAAFLPVDMAKYREVSLQIMAILAGFSPLVEPVSVDEAFVDLTGTERLFGSPEAAVRRIKVRIREETRLTASAGLAPNKFLAKVASDLEKPDGLVVVAPGGEARFLAPLPVERIWGVGRVMARALRELGVTTVAELQRVPRAVLVRRFGRHGEALHALAAELRAGGFAAGRVTLKLRLAPFETRTRSLTGEPTQDALELYRRAAALLERERVARPVRLIGLSASRLGPAGRGQLDLLDPAALRRERLGRVVDRLTARFGQGTVIPASLLSKRTRSE